MPVKPWSGRAVTEARVLVRRWLPRPCGKCGQTVHDDPPGTPLGSSGWVIGHKVDRALRPDLTWEVSNWQPEHRACSDASGQAAVIAKARAEGAASVQQSLFESAPLRVSSPTEPPAQ